MNVFLSILTLLYDNHYLYLLKLYTYSSIHLRLGYIYNYCYMPCSTSSILHMQPYSIYTLMLTVLELCM